MNSCKSFGLLFQEKMGSFGFIVSNPTLDVVGITKIVQRLGVILKKFGPKVTVEEIVLAAPEVGSLFIEIGMATEGVAMSGLIGAMIGSAFYASIEDIECNTGNYSFDDFMYFLIKHGLKVIPYGFILNDVSIGNTNDESFIDDDILGDPYYTLGSKDSVHQVYKLYCLLQQAALYRRIAMEMQSKNIAMKNQLKHDLKRIKEVEKALNDY